MRQKELEMKNKLVLAIKRFKNGSCIAGIAKNLGISRNTVARALRKEGLK